MPNLERPQERVRHRRVPARPVLLYSAVADAKHVNAQARECICQLGLHFFFPVAKALLLVLQGTVIKWCPYTTAVLVPSVTEPTAT